MCDGSRGQCVVASATAKAFGYLCCLLLGLVDIDRISDKLASIDLATCLKNVLSRRRLSMCQWRWSKWCGTQKRPFRKHNSETNSPQTETQWQISQLKIRWGAGIFQMIVSLLPHDTTCLFLRPTISEYWAKKLCGSVWDLKMHEKVHSVNCQLESTCNQNAQN